MLLSPYSNKILSLIFTQRELHLIACSKTPKQTFYFHDTCTVPLSERYLTNPSLIFDHLQEFVKKNNLKNSFTSLALDTDMVTEKIMYFSQEQPTTKDASTLMPRYSLIRMRYLFSHEGKSAYFIASIDAHIVARYLMLLSKLPITISRITTINTGILESARMMSNHHTFNNTLFTPQEGPICFVSLIHEHDLLALLENYTSNSPLPSKIISCALGLTNLIKES